LAKVKPLLPIATETATARRAARLFADWDHPIDNWFIGDVVDAELCYQRRYQSEMSRNFTAAGIIRNRVRVHTY
jgi:hypothetical protein